MTREEASVIIGNLRVFGGDECYSIAEYQEAKAVAIQSLLQAPCDDCISRQSAIFLASDLKQDLPDDERISDMVMAHNEGILEYQTQLSLLPPVTPQPKTGHWIKSRDCYGNNHFTCPFCGNDIATKSDTWNDNYCSNCGARMGSEEEKGE